MNTDPNPFASPTATNFDGEMPEGVRPSSPLVVGILSIVFGGLGLLSGVWSLYYWAYLSTVQGNQGAVFMGNMYGPGYMLTMTLIGFVTSVSLIFAGIGLTKYRHWGRTLFQLYAAVTILLNVGNAAYMILFVIPNLRLDSAIFKGSMYGGAILGIIAGCLFPVIGMIFLLMPRVKSWLR